MQGAIVTLARRRTSATQLFSGLHHVPLISDAFSAPGAGDALALVAGEFFRRDCDPHPFLRKQRVVAQLAIGQHLLPVLFGDLRMESARGFLGRFAGSDAHGASGLEVGEGGRHLAPVEKLQRPLAQPAAGHHGDGVGGAAVDLDEGDKALAILAARVDEAEAFASEHRHPHAQHLAGAQVAVRRFGLVQQLFKAIHIYEYEPPKACFASLEYIHPHTEVMPVSTWRLVSVVALLLCLLPQCACASARHGPGEVALPFEYFRQHIFVSLSVNGRPGLVFMLDSGANRNVLNLRTARQLGIEPEGVTEQRDIGFGDRAIYVAHEKDIDVEMSFVPVAQRVAVMDLSQFEWHFGHPMDGILGYPFFRRFVVKVDYERRLLILEPGDRRAQGPLAVEVPILPSHNFIVVPLVVASDGWMRHSVDAAVDTGSNVVLMLYDRFVPTLGLRTSLRDAMPATAFGLNGYYPVALGIVRRLAIGGAETRNVPVDYLEESEKIGPERDLPGAIGNGLLQSFSSVIFDVPHHRMVLELKPPPLPSGTIRTVTAQR